MKKNTSFKGKKAALYDPYLDVLGGGERHILSILKVLEEEGYQVDVFWDQDLSLEIKKRFNLSFNSLRFQPNIFKQRGGIKEKILLLKDIDLFFYIPDGSYFLSLGKRNYIFAMVPKKTLYPTSLINRLKTWNYQFIANSQFTQGWLRKWGIESQVVYPFIDDKFVYLKRRDLIKDKIILSVGRFYKQLHSKKQDIIINMYKKLQYKSQLFRNFTLILAGGLKKEDISFFNHLGQMIGHQSIIIKPNPSFSELLGLYQKALFYWHFTGFGSDETKAPDQVEHLGIAPLEAMAAGCLVFGYRAGGLRELVRDGENGFLFKTEEELFEKNEMVLKDDVLRKRIVSKAKEFVKKNFSYRVFKNRVKQIFL